MINLSGIRILQRVPERVGSVAKLARDGWRRAGMVHAGSGTETGDGCPSIRERASNHAHYNI